ncbi:hypothetical protein SASPL_139108 [Salvia splendens]|uniref:Uncharacterized protein n=1 Tax=Salvia splendens TaxID=180675 RepID=A0A8X8WWQ0_SALSN|nr:hypothetical protein SASPL_139108 [Salvia splendens]
MVAFTNISFSFLRFCTVSVANNQFSGQIEEFPVVNDLVWLDLSNNRIQGPLPSSFFRFQNISVLWLSDNLFDGTFELRKIQSLSKLTRSLSYNNLSVDTDNLSLNSEGFPQFDTLHLASCNLYEFPNLRNQSVDLWNNHIGGDIRNNILTGVIPTSICTISPLSVLDLSFNNLSGSITKNTAGGKVPKSLINCNNLEVLNVGNNNLEGSFPCMLPLSLRILVLRSNKFQGDLRCRRSWPDLQILDISSNNFGGSMDMLNFSSLRGMMLQSPTHSRLQGMIPTGPQFQTYSADMFEGNPGLCGFPLDRSCSSSRGPASTPSEVKDEEIEWEYVFAAFGYVVGFGSIACALLCCRSFRERYFEKIEELSVWQ